MSTRRDAWDVARTLVVNEGRSYAEASAESGIPLSSLQKRAADEGWRDQQRTAVSYNARVRGLKDKYLQSLETLLDASADANAIAQAAHAWRGIEQAFPEHRYAKKSDPKVRLEIGGEVLRALIEYLSAHDTNALAAIEPHIEGFANVWEDQNAA